MATVESEMKFSSRANTQLKFTPLVSGKDLFLKLRTLCDLLEITLGAERSETINDEYYDDDSSALLKSNCLLRRRTLSGKHLITLKGQLSGIGAMGRLDRMEDEFECSDEDFRRMLADTVLVKDRMRSLGVYLSALGPLRKRIAVKNDRLSADLTTDVRQYSLCHDSFHYFAEGWHSEKFGEVEVERIGEFIEVDAKLEKLRKALTELLGYAPSTESKVKKGIEWISRRGRDLHTVHSVGFDIVGFSKEPAETQKEMIQTLNHSVKKAILSIRGVESGIVLYLPTGDGMILVFEDRPHLVIAVVREVQQKIRRHNEQSPRLRILFRTGLHSGPVFRYSDVNGNPNVAGNGINLVQRVMAAGEEWHILASHEAFECMGNIDPDTKRTFHSVGTHKAKHGVAIELFNVYDEGLNFGNPAAPSIVPAAAQGL